MNMNRQTVWLVTMLTLMVVLSAYYIVTGPVEPADQVVLDDEEADTDSEDAEVETQEKDSGGKGKEEGDEEKKSKDKAASASSDRDYFVGFQLQRSSLRSKMTDRKSVV